VRQAYRHGLCYADDGQVPVGVAWVGRRIYQGDVPLEFEWLGVMLGGTREGQAALVVTGCGTPLSRDPPNLPRFDGDSHSAATTRFRRMAGGYKKRSRSTSRGMATNRRGHEGETSGVVYHDGGGDAHIARGRLARRREIALGNVSAPNP